MPRGGTRQGTPGRSYANRTDLQVVKPLPIQTATGQQYGKAAEQRAAQRAIPMGRPPTDAVPTAPAAPATGGPGASSPAPGPLPGTLTPLDAPTQRPNEPFTAGMPTGAGPGPEALGVHVGPEQSYQSARDHVAMLARSQPGNDALQYLLAQLGVSF